MLDRNVPVPRVLLRDVRRLLRMLLAGQRGEWTKPALEELLMRVELSLHPGEEEHQPEL